MSTGLLPASILPGLLEIALKSRLNVQALFDHAGIDPDAVGRADRYITYEQLDTLLSTAFAQAEDPFFGISVGRDNHYNTLDVLGNLMATSNTLGDALQHLLRYKDLLVPYLHFELRAEGEDAVLSCRATEDLAFTRLRVHNEVVLATIVSIGRSLLGGDMGLRAVRMQHPPAADPSVYEDFFGVPLAFACPRNEVVMDPARFSDPLPTAYPRYHERLRRLADERLASLGRAHGVAGRVTALLEERMGREPIDIEAIAGVLNMTARTLQRRLRREQASFASLRDRVRHETARGHLTAEHCDMEQLARALGFSDTANFYHAFRRWEGCAPGAYRRRTRAGD
jgi:AraC-like DNA-binding protein